MSPDELGKYLDVIKASGLAITRLEIQGPNLKIESVGMVGKDAPVPTEHPVISDLKDLFPGGMRVT